MKFTLFLLPICSFFLPATSSSYDDTNTECNASFGYCLSYPTDVFVDTKPTSSDSFLVKTSADGEQFLLLHYENRVEKDGITRIFQQELNEYLEGQERCKQIEMQAKSKDAFFAIYETELEWHYIEVMLTHTGYLTLQVAMPLQPTRCYFDEVCERVNLMPFGA